ncbi:MAG: hypothetical protein JNJ95_08870 [Dechloromonas sp.]|nr:hypothetical protein [Dechloromonas sp.]
MPYTISWEAKGVYKQFSGVVTADEYHRSQIQFTSHEKFDNAHYVINDFSDIDRFVMTPAEAEYMATYSLGPHFSNPTLRVCFVTTDPSIVGLIQAYKKLSAFPLEAFPTLAAARQSLATR